MSRLRRPLIGLAVLAPLLALALAPAAQAYNDGRGFYGATNDKVVTDAGFILIVFFPTFIFVMSMIQRHLEKRKAARTAAHKAHLGNAQWRGGW
jgi:preprotein translocase subunit SecG